MPIPSPTRIGQITPRRITSGPLFCLRVRGGGGHEKSPGLCWPGLFVPSWGAHLPAIWPERASIRASTDWISAKPWEETGLTPSEASMEESASL